jgi:hypothetical protein
VTTLQALLVDTRRDDWRIGENRHAVDDDDGIDDNNDGGGKRGGGYGDRGGGERKEGF